MLFRTQMTVNNNKRTEKFTCSSKLDGVTIFFSCYSFLLVQNWWEEGTGTNRINTFLWFLGTFILCNKPFALSFKWIQNAVNTSDFTTFIAFNMIHCTFFFLFLFSFSFLYFTDSFDSFYTYRIIETIHWSLNSNETLFSNGICQHCHVPNQNCGKFTRNWEFEQKLPERKSIKKNIWIWIEAIFRITLQKNDGFKWKFQMFYYK